MIINKYAIDKKKNSIMKNLTNLYDNSTLRYFLNNLRVKFFTFFFILAFLKRFPSKIVSGHMLNIRFEAPIIIK